MKRYLPVIIILLLMLVVYLTGTYRYFSFDCLKASHFALKAYVASHPVLTPILFILIYIISTALSIPGSLFLSLMGGFLFPIPWSTIYVLVGATVGATLLFVVAKTAFRDVLRKKAGPFLKKMADGFHENAVSYMLFLRFVPIFPFWLVNLTPAFFNVTLRTYIWTTAVGILPGVFVFTVAGAGLGAIFETGDDFSLSNILNTKLKIALIALGIFALIPIIIKKLRKK